MPSKEPYTPTEPVGKLNLRIDGKFIDPNKHLNHVAWGIHLENGRIKTAEDREITIGGRLATNTFLQRARIDFKDQIKEGDEVEIVTEVSHLDGLVVFGQKIINTESSKIAGEAITVHGAPDPTLALPSEPPLLDLSLRLDEDFFLLKGHPITHLAALAGFEEERLRLLLSRGLTMEELSKMGLLAMATSIDVHYAKEMGVGQDVNMRTTVSTQGVRLLFNQQMIESGHVINGAQSTYVVIDTSGEKMKIIRPPTQLVNKLIGPQVIDVPYSTDTRWLK